jgi:hypothetical protein
MKRTIAKNTLSFMTSKSYTYIRTPKDIWQKIQSKMKYCGIKMTIDVCASDKNHLLPRYYTKEQDGLEQDWTGEVVYCHPPFDMHIGKWVEKAFNSDCLTIMLLPASTHTRYFHRYIYNNPKCQIEFLEKPKQGFAFGTEDGQYEIPKGKVGYIKPLMIVIFNNKS